MAEKKDRELYNELQYYTLSHPDPDFIHQHAVNAFAAQTADENTRPITLIFALEGLYHYLEEGFTGKEVRDLHGMMAQHKMDWPEIKLPANRGNITVKDVLDKPEGPERDEMIRKWCEAVWEAYEGNRETILEVVRRYESK